MGRPRIRQDVRAWINDHVRLDPEYTPDTEVLSIRSRYDEDTELDGSPEET